MLIGLIMLDLPQSANVSAKAVNFRSKKFLLIHSMADSKFTIYTLVES